MKMMIRKIHLTVMAVAAVLCAACDAHIDVPDTAVRPGHILCEGGTTLPYGQYEQSGKRAIAVVFDTGQRDGTEGNGYAVYLWEIAPAAFADSLGIEQGTSADIEAYDGNTNTFALYDTKETASPMAEAVFDLVAVRTECLYTVGSADALAVCHPGGGQSHRDEMRR